MSDPAWYVMLKVLVTVLTLIGLLALWWKR